MTPAAGRDGGAAPRIGLALGAGGARGLAHIQLLRALDDLGLRPARISGASIGALIGAGYAAGLSGQRVAEHVLTVLANRRLAAGRLWRSRPATIAEFMADGGLRLGQLNAERVVAAFLPELVPARLEDLPIPLSVMTTSFYEGAEWRIESGGVASAVGASVAIPSVFRPVCRDGRVLIDGGVTNPLPFDALEDCDFVIACDVVGGPEMGGNRAVPTSIETMFGASQLMMGSITRAKLSAAERIGRRPDVLLQPPVSHYRVLDFLRAPTILAETAPLRIEARERIATAFAERGWRLGPAPVEDLARSVF